MSVLSLEQYESDLPFLLGSNKQCWLDSLNFGHVTSIMVAVAITVFSRGAMLG